MAIVTKPILKGYFETGDRPTEAQFIDLIDSLAVMGGNSGDITFIGTVTATTGSFEHLVLTGGSSFDSITVGGGYMGAFAGSGLTITNTGQLSTDDYILTDTYVSASTFLSTPKIKSPSTNFIIIQNAITVQGSITASGDVTAVTGSFDNLNVTEFSNVFSTSHVTASGNILAQTGSFAVVSASGDISASGISASAGYQAGTESTSSFGFISASGDISSSGTVFGLTGSFGKLLGDGSSLTGIQSLDVHGNQVSITGSQTVPEGVNNTIVTNNSGEFTVPAGAEYTVNNGGQVDLQYTPIAERLYRYDVDTGHFIPYAQANIDSETTLMKGFGAGTAGVGNDVTIRHNATVPENFVTILHTTTNVTQSEDPNNNPMTTDPHSITIQDQSTYTVKQGADVTVDGVHHGVVRKDIALFKTMGIGDTQAIGPSGSDSFNDQYNNIYPSASAHLHISASNPVVKIEAASGTGLLSIDGNISASGGTITALSGSFSELSGNSPLTVNGETIFTGPITASGNISASGTIEADSFTSDGKHAIGNTGVAIVVGNQADFPVKIGRSGTTNIELRGPVTASGHISASGNLILDGNITASTTSTSSLGFVNTAGNISSSATLFGTSAIFASNGTIKATINSFGHVSSSGNITASNLLLDGSTIDFTNLPTSDPGVAGRLYNDSGTIKISL